MKYSVMECFYTLQGEGSFAGQAAYFIRLAGCDIGCTWCDVKESWTTSNATEYTASNLASKAAKHSSKYVVITGGEPCMCDLTALTDELHKVGKKVHLETSAAYPISGNFDWVCVSPKKFKIPTEESLSKADELKIIIFNKSDFKWAEEYKKMVKKSCKLFLQPEWDKKELMYPLIIEFIKKHPEWIISIQNHKYLDIP